jgi:S-DNA-T family DNA segregation ATPase FtsK/SpoIIIE
MSHKIIKYSLLSLLILVLLNAGFLVLAENVPDNIYQISDSTESVNSFVYYGTSLISVLTYYSGVWLALPFLLIILSFIFVIHKRVKALDSIVPFVILGFGYTFTLLLLPEFVGEGLLKLSLKSLTLNQLMILNVCFALASFFIILRGSLKDIALTLQNFGRLIGRKCLKLIQASWTYLRKVFKGQKKVIDFEKMIGRFGVGLKRAGANNNKSFEQDRVEDSYQKMARKIQVEEIETISEPIPSLSSAEGLPRYEEAAPSTEVKPKKAPARKPKKKVDSFFESKQLIDCIATDEQKINIQGPDDEYFSSITESIQNKLAEFNIEARVVNILKGPVVDTFELRTGCRCKG